MFPPPRPHSDSEDSDQQSHPPRSRSTQYLEVPSSRRSSSQSSSRHREPRSRTQSPILPGVAFPILRSQPIEEDPPDLFAPESSIASTVQDEAIQPPDMSSYSSSSQEDSVYSSPGPQRYQLVSPGTLNDPRTMSQVSPGFIYVTFLTRSVCFYTFPFLMIPLAVCCNVLECTLTYFNYSISESLTDCLSWTWLTYEPEQQGPAHQLSADPSCQHYHRTPPHRKDFCLPRLGRGHGAHDQRMGSLRELEQPPKRIARFDQKLPVQLGMSR